MSYLHCPTCSRAYNVAAQSACPYCPVTAVVVDAREDIVAAAEQLARALERATPADRRAAAERMDAGTLRAFYAAIEPALPQPPPPRPPLLLAVARAVVTRIETRIEAHLATRPRLRRATDRVWTRVRALAA